jgi:predicted ferric reductase
VSWRVAIVLTPVLVLATMAARISQDPQTGTAAWDSARASGFAAYLLIWASVLSGVAMHMRFRPAGGGLTWVLEVHRITSTLSVTFIVVHVAGLLMDPVVHFSLVDGLVPFTSSFRPFQVGLGALSQWSLVAVLASTAFAGRMSWSVWKRFHYLSVPAYVLALLHGVTSGSDTGQPAATAIYAVTAAALAAVCVARLAGRGWVQAGETVSR